MSTDLKPEAPTTVFPSGDSRALAVLADEPIALARRYGLAFAEGVDDLDQFRYATVDLGDDHQVVLYKHFGDPSPGTVVRIDADDDPKVARRQLSAKLLLSGEDVLWWSPEA